MMEGVVDGGRQREMDGQRHRGREAVRRGGGDNGGGEEEGKVGWIYII